MTAEAVRAALGRVVDPEIHRPITELDMVRSVSVTDGVATVDLALTIIGCPAADTIERDVRAAVLSTPGIESLQLAVGVMTVPEREALVARLRGTRTTQFGPDTLTKIYAITSGKGGVGKSTLTANLAVALAAQGLKVGLVDADVFGFSIPGILGLGAEARPTKVGDLMMPPSGHGVAVISIGMFVPSTGSGQATRAVSWRGPLLHRTIQQFLTDVWFGDLDILLLDLPPGTGDIAISIGQLLPHAEVLVVTTPQPAAAEVAERSGLVARQTGQTVIGVIENMTGELFGSGGGDAVAARLDVPVLARIPLSVPLREGGDVGTPVVLSSPVDPAAVAIRNLAVTLAARGRGLPGRRLPVSPTQPTEGGGIPGSTDGAAPGASTSVRRSG